MKTVTIHTDGSCLGNPGPGGWAAVLNCNGKIREMNGGYRHTTNNRMEIMASIAALEVLTEACEVTLYTDSQYLRHAVEKRWLEGWKKNGWKTAAKQPVKNKDLWERLDRQLGIHQVKFAWVRGHAGDPNNERCDELARTAAQRPAQPEDAGMAG